MNTGNANAGTGAAGSGGGARDLRRGRRSCSPASPEQVLPFSTGVIMEPLPVDRIERGLPQLRRAR